MSDLSHQRDPAHPDLGRPLDEPLVPSAPSRALSTAEERSPDNVPGYEQMGSTFTPGSPESAQGAFAVPADDVSTFVIADRAAEEDIPIDPLNDGQGRPMQ